MTDETGLAADERAALMAWWNSDWPRDGSDVLDTLAETVAGIFAARVARLADPATVEAVAVNIMAEDHVARADLELHPLEWHWQNRFNDADRAEYRLLAEAALAVVRGLLGGTGEEGA